MQFASNAVVISLLCKFGFNIGIQAGKSAQNNIETARRDCNAADSSELNKLKHLT